MSDLRAKRTQTSLNSLKNIGPNSTAEVKFILDTTPFDDDNEPSPKDDWSITGRLLLNSPIYKDGAVIIQIVIGTGFPLDPPKVLVKTAVFHPNISKEGEVCIDILKKDGSWSPTITLVAAIQEVIKIIDNPSIDRIQYTEAANLYDTNKSEYERKAKEIFTKNCAPRK